MPRKVKHCPNCTHALRSEFTISVSAEKFAVFQKAAKDRGWSVARLVEEATR